MSGPGKGQIEHDSSEESDSTSVTNAAVEETTDARKSGARKTNLEGGHADSLSANATQVSSSRNELSTAKEAVAEAQKSNLRGSTSQQTFLTV